MERRASFGSLNNYNVMLNKLSGNFFPLSNQTSTANFFVKCFIVTTWVIKLGYYSTMLIGRSLYVPAMVAIQESGTAFILTSETIILSAYCILKHRTLSTLIDKVNKIVVDTDHFKKCLRDTVEPRQRYMNIYIVGVLFSVVMWAVSPIMKILERDVFYPVDFTVTAYLPGPPFGTITFVAGVMLQVFGIFYISCSKISIDSYMTYFVMFLTAEYTYIRERLAETIRRKDNEEYDEVTVADELRKCVDHHCAVIETGHMVIDIFAVHVTVAYINNILKFCFLGFAFITFADSFIYKWVHFTYLLSIVVQTYILCASAQELLEASVSVTDDAFYEDWHSHDKNVKRMFNTIELSNQIECRVTAYGAVDLTIPTLAVIVRKAYSACLLLLEVR